MLRVCLCVGVFAAFLAISGCMFTLGTVYGVSRAEKRRKHRRAAESQRAPAAAHDLSVSVEGHALIAGVQIAVVDDSGALLVPKSAKYALVEIGTSDRDTLDEKLDTTHRDAFLLSVEPLLDKYSVLISRSSDRGPRDRASPVGHHHVGGRGVALPLAVSTDGREANLTVHRVAGCSSLADLNPDARHTRLCLSSGQLEKRRVPTITLERTLSLIPESLTIRLLKMDAQVKL